jgi:hypothetical protein
MAQNLTPAHWLPSWSEDGTNITVPIASFPELTAGEADGATGDIRKTVYAICEKLNAAYQAEAQADRPAQMVITRGQNLNAAGQIVKTFSFTFVLAPTALDVAPEA